ncbi:prephenate dehydrogenase [Kocuria tytonis]|uniref:Prephenate dehydrogenase n=1 Tax=Kocuria tytonis TaxID=2054280 RepID=A0A495A8J2_9MICC|nr:prephenate dehydrogenase [Kocuria tytonis]RKQ36132.1 prephenate dehydrogenase [Kocuria tytonis]
MSVVPTTAASAGPVLVIGSGLLGASIGLGLRHLGVEVVLRDSSPTTEAVAQDIGAGRSERAALAAGAVLPEPALVVVAAPPDVVAELVVRALTEHPDAVVLDIASVKAPVLDAVRAAGADLTRYVGTHPMAGREKSGPVAARGELFTSMPWVISPGEDTGAAAIAAARNLAVDLGATVTVMEPREHDETVALISHLPQVMSSLLASRLQDTPLHHLSLAGQGLRDTTRIAGSDPGLWVQILAANAQPVLDSLHAVRADLERLIATLERPGADGARLDIARLMAEGNAGRARIPGKHGGAPTAFATLTVAVDDTPGQIARLLTEIGEIGVNLEDMRLEHSPGQPVGLVTASVEPSRHADLVEELQTRGWKVVQ